MSMSLNQKLISICIHYTLELIVKKLNNIREKRTFAKVILKYGKGIILLCPVGQRPCVCFTRLLSGYVKGNVKNFACT